MNELKVAIAQIAPVWLNRDATLQKVADYIRQAAEEKSDLVVFGEALVPGYPFWVERTEGARFNSPLQKQMYAHYLDQGVVIERGDLEPLAKLCAEYQIATYLGVMERAPDRGGHSLYCTLVYIDKTGEVGSVHRKLQPTYEERLVWAQGDGHGLRTHQLNAFTLGGLNCYENWLPLARAALYGQGEDLRIAVWPGSNGLTQDITRFVALEGRSFVVSASGIMRPSDMPNDLPVYELMMVNAPNYFANGGSAVAAPNGDWLLSPQAEQEGLFCVELDHRMVREARQNFDVAGHYARPDVTRLEINRERQSTVHFAE
mgnify:CR=1 FL=1